MFVGEYTVFMSVHPSVCPSLICWFFFNISKRQWWKFIKFCRHIDINKMYIYNRKWVIDLCNSYCCIGSAYTGISTCSQLLPKHPDTLYTQCRHTGHLHEEVWLTKWKHFELSHFLHCFLIRVLLVLRLCMHGEINLYQSFYWSHLILCIHNVDTLNICMKKFDAIKNFFWQYDTVLNLAIF